MKFVDNILRALPLLNSAATQQQPFPRSSLIVDIAPTVPQSYVLPNLKGSAVDFGGLIIRILVSNATSSGSLSLLSVSSGPSGLNLIHSHAEVEAFYTIKGSVQVFHNTDQGREVRANDFALLAPGNNHTYRPNDPDFQLTLCMAPGGIDGFFTAAGEKYVGRAPFNPLDDSKLDIPKVAGLMPKYNISPAPGNSIDMDWVNGTTEDGVGVWHVEEQKLPEDGSPYFVASNRGPKYLQRESGQVVAQLASTKQTKDKLSVATIAMRPSDQPSDVLKFDVDQAFQVVEGQLSVEINGEVTHMIFGDVAFLPKGDGFRYWSTVGFTKFLVWSAGPGLADCLIEKAERWDHAVWPA